MAITSYPFDGQAATESQYSRLFRELQDSGVAASADSLDLKVTADGTGMNVKVQPGVGIVRGHIVQSTAIETLAIEAADASLRHDRVVLRLDPTANGISLAVVKGTPGQGAPALTQTDTDIYEISLGVVEVGSGVVTIISSKVMDDRSFIGSRIGAWTTDTRPANPRLGQLGYNRTTNAWEFWGGAGWRDLAPTISWDSVANKPTEFPPSSHTHVIDYNDVVNKPLSFPPSSHSHSWSSITSKPSTFPPSSHSHSWSSITSKPSTYPPSGHSHSSYLTYGETISWANGSKKPHNNAASGSGTWYSVWVEGNGVFCRNTSSIKFKENVRDKDIDPDAILNLRPVIYDRKPQEREDGTMSDPRKDEVGLIAEEVEKHFPWLINYLDGEVDGLRYDLLPVAMIPTLKKQRDRINELEQRLAALEAKLGGTAE